MLPKLIFFCILIVVAESSLPCNPRSTRIGNNPSVVCVCNADYCDTIDKIQPIPSGQYLHFESNVAGLRFEKSTGNVLAEGTVSNDISYIIIDHSVKYQSIIGFGGAFTDAAGININALSTAAADKLLRSYYSDEGLEYNLGRVPIGGSDFSTHAYSYDDGPEDPDLVNFQLSPEDFQYKIPYILQAKTLSNNNFQLFASAWTAPKWMKTNGEYTGGELLENHYQTWSNYHLKFVQEYEKRGVSVEAISTGNEPSLALVPGIEINTVGWTSLNMSNYIANNLGPTIKSNYSNLKILTLDDQRFFLPWWIDEVLVDKPAFSYVDGIGLHWYWDKVVPASVLDLTHDLVPDKFLLGTESCRGDKDFEKPVNFGDWSRAEDYASAIIEDLQHWVTGWIDWNLCLNMTGGPTYISNEVDAAIIVDETVGEFYKQPIYYALGHFAKFLPEGAVRVEQTYNDSNLQVVAFERPDSGTTVVVFNKGTVDVPVSIHDLNKGFIETVVSANSINSFVYW